MLSTERLIITTAADDDDSDSDVHDYHHYHNCNKTAMITTIRTAVKHEQMMIVMIRYNLISNAQIPPEDWYVLLQSTISRKVSGPKPQDLVSQRLFCAQV